MFKNIICLMLLCTLSINLISQKITTDTLFVDGVCGMCEDRIEESLKIKGIKKADWNVGSHLLVVKYNAKILSLMDIHKKVASVGHDTKLVKASDEAYNSLHGCCKYRSDEIKKEHGIDIEKDSNENQEHKNHPNEHLGKDNHSHSNKLNNVIIEGKVLEIDNSSIPLVQTLVYCLESNESTFTDEEGYFSLKRTAEKNTIVISAFGYPKDTIVISDEKYLEVKYEAKNSMLKEFEVIERLKSTEISLLTIEKVENIGQAELQKAACCNLSESFETIPSVDVSFSDAVTGTRQIQLLGLAGPYTLITKEAIPDIRGMSSVFGFGFIPGFWINNISLSKGVGSVVQGYEAISGQIDLQLKNFNTNKKLGVNIYANQSSRTEFNLNYNSTVSERIKNTLLLHYDNRSKRIDNNDDGFLDMALGQSIAFSNKLKYEDPTNGWAGQLLIEGVYTETEGGQDTKKIADAWTLNSDTRKLNTTYKMGRVYAEKPYKSMGLQLNVNYFDYRSKFGNSEYNNEQFSTYFNYIYQNIINNSDHQYKLGVNYRSDNYKENINSTRYGRTEIIPGSFAEYTFKGHDKFNAIAGIRGDYHNTFGFFVTPKIMLKYAVDEISSIRLTAGRGQKTANIFAENIGLFSTNRTIIVNRENENTPYGLDAEIAYNFGLSYTRKQSVFNREMQISIDAYTTHFQNQIVVDWENAREISFYNLNGRSYSNTAQLQIDYELIKNFDVRLAYRWVDVKVDYQSGLKQKPLTSEHRILANLSYTTKSNWNFDFTLNWNGKKRLPSTEMNSVPNRLDEYSPDFILANMQISKKIKENWRVYLGAENLFDYKQDNPIINAENPFQQEFDASIIWAPIFGRNIYLGIDFEI